MMEVGFIGLGDQGGPMAEMMIRAGVPLSVWARREEVAAAYSAQGAKVSATPASLAASVDMLGLCVTTDEDIREIVYGRGVLEALRPGSILAVHSTIMPSLCVELAAAAAERNIRLLDAPVSGSGRAALAKTLLVMVGGESEALEQAKPAFLSYANPIIHVGRAGDAMTVKLLNNLLAAAHQGVALRALRGGRDMGVAPDVARTVMLSGVARSYALDLLPRLQVVERARHIGSLVKKDIALARKALTSAELIPLFALADEVIAALGDWGRGDNPVFSHD